MTRSEARRRAVEAAIDQWRKEWNAAARGELNSPSEMQRLAMAAAVDEFERAMADAGWRVVRDVGEKYGDPHDDMLWAYADGWNACRAAMLKDEP